ncbi:hypothetical protein PF005_g8506 [Phytophthora fragariae]|uniref:Uncharacterized protein n=2 Tax=Phytophthora fragariae TaxID=53985 RepID=A0A6A3UJE0_9STRA|nr:hypothetical protein PF003_g32110 [Phytophthora fragariae]KAE8940360.1 hypothetical protein PF009_g9824 [Phytophthora fragariae]KAE9016213.1 hypothetical protein PF011_g7257 [Phytophthora fragariae]KAE9117173.1 hypothetical protein PF007_g9383 [Phytophthora fragariae]KAE9118414.1 hypothetical protein PF010_g8220 [Phytophthora fragariae]
MEGAQSPRRRSMVQSLLVPQHHLLGSHCATKTEGNHRQFLPSLPSAHAAQAATDKERYQQELLNSPQIDAESAEAVHDSNAYSGG